MIHRPQKKRKTSGFSNKDLLVYGKVNLLYSLLQILFKDLSGIR